MMRLSLLFPYGWRSPPGRLALALFFSALYVYLPVFTLYLQSNGLSLLQVNSLWGILVAVLFLSEAPTGMIADRVGRARAVQLALAFQLLGELLFLFGRSYPAYAVAAAVGGVGFAFASGSAEALVYDWLLARGREGEMSRAMGYINAAHRLGQLVGFGVGGWLALEMTPARFRLGIGITAGMVAVGWLFVFGLEDESRAEHEAESGSSLQLIGDGLRLVRSNRVFLRLILLAVFTLPFGDYLLNLYQPYFVAKAVPPIWLGWGMALGSLLGVFLARSAWRLDHWFGPRGALLLAAALPGALYLVFAAARGPGWIVLCFVLLTGSISLKQPLFSAQLNRHIPSHNRATILSLISMVTSLYDATMGLLIGAAADAWGLSPAFLMMGGIVLLGALIFGARPGLTDA